MERKEKTIPEKRNKIMLSRYPKIFSLILIITGTTLFSCTDKDNKKQNNEIEIVDSEKNEVNEPKQIPHSSQLSKEENPEHPEKNIEINNEQVISSSKKRDQVKLAEPKNNKNLQSAKTSHEKNSSDKVKITATPAGETISQTNAEFPGGIDQFHNFFMKEYKRPENVSYWKLNINIAFAIEKNGTLTFLECSPKVEEPLEKEIIRVLSLCPKWQPGESNGKKIRMQYSVSILLK
ncbi:hypothetical protein DMB65_05895 [Flavobacterium cheongpyeongense]|jgi:hypothetical protein|uniref:TonB C-terminal domain-containing protein n=2 Tax=Flavobacterium cheongpyeongense TaxID=2212651 RepID=A0A2V4BUF2_9FLAO|nr:hypothetical protein DMB65_05895 [Flavobacterium cheongpyeongense]